MLGWRLPRRCGTTPPSTHAEPWLSSAISDGVHQRDLDVASAAGPLPLGQRGLDPDHREQPADEVDDRGADLQRRAVLLAGDAHQPAHRLEQEVVAGQAPRLVAGGPEGGDRAGDEPRVARAERVAVEAPARHQPGAEGLDQHVGPQRRAGARARRRRRRRGRARARACCGSARGSRSPRRRGTAGPSARVSSPPSGRSTLTTSAPRSPSSIVASGPASTREKSATRMPSSGATVPAH